MAGDAADPGIRVGVAVAARRVAPRSITIRLVGIRIGAVRVNAERQSEGGPLVAEVLEISQKTLKTIYQNFVASVGINSGGLIFSAVGRLSPMSAAVVHNASTIVVVLNSLKLGRQVAGSNPPQLLSEVKV